jgi:imidazolonepropionase-like amidohydrolase
MLEHCITFFKEEPGEEADIVVFHYHVTAPDGMLAVEVALRETVRENISLAGATGVEVRLVTDLPPGLVDTMEALRRAQHGTAIPAQQVSSHLH